MGEWVVGCRGLDGCGGLVVSAFPLTPALFLGERESDAARLVNLRIVVVVAGCYGMCRSYGAWRVGGQGTINRALRWSLEWEKIVRANNLRRTA